jgi:hypothetical protein
MDFPPYIIFTDAWLHGVDEMGGMTQFTFDNMVRSTPGFPFICILFDAWLEGDDADGWHDIVHLDNMMEMMKES